MTPSPAKRENGGSFRLLILGGTAEASALARAVAGRAGIAPLLSFAGRTESPVAPPIPYRIGGFGGAEGLAGFLRTEAIDAVVDATHPFAARISANAVTACGLAGVPLAVFTRPAWQPISGDTWISVPDIAAAVDTLRDLCPELPPNPVILSRPQRGRIEGRTALQTRGNVAGNLRPSTRSLRDRLRMTGWDGGSLGVFLTTGRLDLARFQAAPQHRYLLRTIDPPNPADLPPQATVLLARPPFSVEGEVALMKLHAVELLVTKNSGGAASAAKLAASRLLGLPVLMVERPTPSSALEFVSLEAVLVWIDDQVGRAKLAPT